MVPISMHFGSCHPDFGIDFWNIPKTGSHWHLRVPQPCLDLFYRRNGPFQMLNNTIYCLFTTPKYMLPTDIGWPMKIGKISPIGRRRLAHE